MTVVQNSQTAPGGEFAPVPTFSRSDRTRSQNFTRVQDRLVAVINVDLVQGVNVGQQFPIHIDLLNHTKSESVLLGVM